MCGSYRGASNLHRACYVVEAWSLPGFHLRPWPPRAPGRQAINRQLHYTLSSREKRYLKKHCSETRTWDSHQNTWVKMTHQFSLPNQAYGTQHSQIMTAVLTMG